MATPRASKTNEISDKKLRGLWKNFAPAKLVELLRLQQPAGRWTASGMQVKGRCPYHDDHNPSFVIRLDRGYAACFACEAFVTNPVALWAQITSTTQAAAFGDLKQHFSIDGFSDAQGKKLAAWDRNQAMKKTLMRLCHSEMLNAIADPTNPEFAALQPAVDFLLRVRQIPVNALPSLTNVGILPPLIRLIQLLTAETLAKNQEEAARAAEVGERPSFSTGFADDIAKYLEPARAQVGGIVFSLDRAPSVISRFKVRRPNSKEFVILSDEFESQPGFFGLSWPMYRPMFGSSREFHAPYVVEGEFDALSIMARQVLAGVPNFMVVSVGGSLGNTLIDDLHALGFDGVNLVGDAPHKKGERLIKEWLAGIDKLHAKIFTGHALWPGAGDPDDAVVQLGLPAVETPLLDVDNPDLFKTPSRWLADLIRDDIADIPAEQTRRRVELASSAGKTLRNANDRDDFVRRCHEEFEIAPASLKRDISTQTDTPEGFIYRTAEEMARIFFVIGVRRDGDRDTLRLWHRETKRVVVVPMSMTGDSQTVLLNLLGPAWRFFDEHIGVPEWIEQQIAAQRGVAMQKRDQVLRFYLAQAINTLALNAIDCATAPVLGQGIHPVFRGGDLELYLVNGSDVYHGVFGINGLRWRELEGPSDGGYLFGVDVTRWAKSIHSADDLHRAGEVDVATCLDKVHAYLREGWRFKNHDETAEFLAHHLLATTVAPVFDRRPIIALNGETSAGKSKLLLGLIAGEQDKDIHLIEATAGALSYTAAGWKQEMNEKTLAACLDEFENDGSSARASAVENIQTTIFRGMQSGNNIQRLGGKNGRGTGYVLKFFVFTAAIHRARDAQDLNRVVQVSLEKVPGRDAPEKVLLRMASAEEFAQLRADLTIGLLPHVKTLREHFREVDKALTPAALPGVKIEDRFKNGLLPAMSVMRFLGRDPVKFIERYCAAHEDSLAATGTRSDSGDIFAWVTQTAAIPVDSGSGRSFVTFLSLLATAESRAMVNTSQTGLYFDENTKTLVINWTMATQSVLRAHPKFGRSGSTQNLRELANRLPRALKTAALEASGALSRLRSYGLHGIPAHQLTGYDLRDLLEELTPDVSGNAPTQGATIIPLQKNDATFG